MEEKATGSRNNTPPKAPAWVKVFFIVIVLLILVVIIVHLMGVRFDHGGAADLLGMLMSHDKLLQSL
jgi:hypothetical protein